MKRITTKKKIIVLSAIASGIIIFLSFFYLILRFSPYKELNAFITNRKYSTRIFDCAETLIQILPLENGLRREYISLDELPSETISIFLQAEDKRFYKHKGIDLSAIIRAIFQNVSEGRSVSGASTITMQLARIIEPNAKRTIAIKILEAYNALRIETRLAKREILELYINNIPFGFNTEGISSASKTFFGKPITQLSVEQLCCLAVIPRRPSLYNPLENPEINAKIAYELAFALYPKANLQHEDFITTSKNAKSFKYPNKMPHYIRYLSTLKDSPLYLVPEVKLAASNIIQDLAENLLKMNIEKYESNRLNNGAILVIDNFTGEIISWVGSNDFYDEISSGQIDGVLAKNQPGSSMKPFLYALALENGYSPSTVLPDTPMEFGFEELYIPQNFNNRYNGPVRFRTALASSLNVPAVYLLNSLGIDKYLSKLYELGFSSLENTSQGLSLALGSAEVSLYEMVQGFSIFARDGLFLGLKAGFLNTKVYLYNDQFSSKVEKVNSQQSYRVFDSDISRIICDILSDKDSRATGFGYNQLFETKFPAMFKTGTANQFQNITALGSTPLYTVGVWMGNFSGETIIGKTGSSIPATIAKEILIALQGNTQTKQNTVSFLQPEQYKKVEICSLSGMKPNSFCPTTILEYEETSLQRNQLCNWHTETSIEYPAEYESWHILKERQGNINYYNDKLSILSPRNNSVFFFDEAAASMGSQNLKVQVTGGNNDILFVYHKVSPLKTNDNNRKTSVLAPIQSDTIGQTNVLAPIQSDTIGKTSVLAPIQSDDKNKLLSNDMNNTTEFFKIERPFTFSIPLTIGEHTLTVECGTEIQEINFTVK